MRIKILGPITGQRLSDAFAIALNRYSEINPDCEIKGANLYLSAFDSRGVPFDLVDHDGKPIIITVQPESVKSTKPTSFTPKPPAQQKNGDPHQEWSPRNNSDGKVNPSLRKQARIDRRRERNRVIWEELMEEHVEFIEQANELTSHLLQKNPDDFIKKLNAAVEEVWRVMKPKLPSGPSKGEIRPLPVFAHESGSLTITASSWKNVRFISNPAWHISPKGIDPIWKHDAWEAFGVLVWSMMLHESTGSEDDLNAYEENKLLCARLALSTSSSD